MDDLLATHFAHLFIRDPIVIFSEDLKSLDLSKVDHFENLQSTNWQHMRFKPPPPGNETGWRVEFRPMEIQMTDFENAAFSIFIVLITRAILSFDLNFYIPILLVTENMETAHARDAVSEKTFYFRKDPLSSQGANSHNSHQHRRHQSRSSSISSTSASRSTSPGDSPGSPASEPQSPVFGPVEDEYELMSINDIINGQQASGLPPTPGLTGASGKNAPFPGLIPLVESYLNSVNVDVETRCELARYLDLIRKRADGSLWTGAKWIREFVKNHDEYKHDSFVSRGIGYDLCKEVESLANPASHSSRSVNGNAPSWAKLLGKHRS